VGLFNKATYACPICDTTLAKSELRDHWPTHIYQSSTPNPRDGSYGYTWRCSCARGNPATVWEKLPVAEANLTKHMVDLHRLPLG
jgi:hypothetical protein